MAWPGLDWRWPPSPGWSAAGRLRRAARVLHARTPHHPGGDIGRSDGCDQRVDLSSEAVDRGWTPSVGGGRFSWRWRWRWRCHAVRRGLRRPRPLSSDPTGRRCCSGRDHIPWTAGTVVATRRALSPGRPGRCRFRAKLHGSAPLEPPCPDRLRPPDRGDRLFDRRRAPVGHGGRCDDDRPLAVERLVRRRPSHRRADVGSGPGWGLSRQQSRARFRGDFAQWPGVKV
ncbi:hypothetical protein BH10PSE4_BH10PSE4_16800 [soil metagenome]